ncbi:MAG: L-aspartate oxidase [Candidatus Levybacteria bacterium GW2011_GWA2_37_36]|nr:MAG: L-aspartate oxidase [Candidatus Levybacteria bacterium GW2011_GWA2_37_36]
MKNNFDYIIVGSGAAGLTTALTLRNAGNVAIFTKKNPSDSSTNLAQGGMAAMIGGGDRADWHIEDTMKSGDFHNKKKAVSLLVKNSREALNWLKKQGVLFDKKPSLEAGHRLPRIFHTTDFTGADIEKTLLKKISGNKNIKTFKNSLAIDLIVKENNCEGVFVLTEDNKIVPFFAKAIILATGGSGQVYQWTTNPEVATGDGVAIASRSRVKISDLEFVQFHPTAFKGSTSPLFLLSERLRGEGAKLVDKKGNRFVDELLPRDELTRAIFEKQKSSEVYLTMSHLDKKEIIKKLPNIYKRLKTYGYDLTKDRVPITPAAHYQCGGVVTDLNGKTSIKNLFAVGEVARTGVHGANRLASNSLLEGVVFGKRVGEFLKKIQKSKEQKPACRQAGQKFQFKSQKFKLDQTNINTIKKFKIDIQKTMWEKVGIVRCKSEMLEALKQFEGCKKQIGDIKEKTGISLQLIEVLNLVEIALQITQAALNRPKSLGAHYLGRIN